MSYSFSENALASQPTLIVHRVNLVDQYSLSSNPELIALVGSKSGISIGDSVSKTILLPASAGAEVDCWVFGKKKIIITHNNPDLDRLAEYPTLNEYINLWQEKRSLEKKLKLPHGPILVNLKTHGSEEELLKEFDNQGIPLDEIILLDEETPATDRLLKKENSKVLYSGVARRVSRIESLDNVLLFTKQSEYLDMPKAIFYDSIGFWHSNTYWPFDVNLTAEMYRKAPQIQSIICCPSRWGYAELIKPLALRLTQSGLKMNYIMTDIHFINEWIPFLRSA